MRTIIIEDIPLARELLKKDIQNNCPELELVGEADGVLAGLKLIKNSNPELVFLDIHLGDGEAFEILELIDSPAFKIIFTTASDEYAIKAFEVSAIDYLLKPISQDRLTTAVKKAIKSKHPQKENISILKETVKKDHIDRIALHTQEQIYIAKTEDIIRCEADGNYTKFHFLNHSPLLVTKTLKSFNNLFSTLQFIRTHQSHLVNRDHIQAYVKTEGGYLLMSDESRVPVALRKKAEVMKVLG